ncbi:mitochondrial import inner membrane translocase subunit TIM14 [Hamiltosporidium tvaerminnensis]|nr:mitochondrial import inner membrane translocase subunit TIM14 [Hamiltosporidium tvaerminnensis]
MLTTINKIISSVLTKITPSILKTNLLGFKQVMDIKEAKSILEVKGVSKEEIDRRYKEVLFINHPDRKGSPYLAAKINEARRVLEGM